MIYGILSILLFAGILLWMEYRIIKLERVVNQVDTITHLLMYDYLKRNKKKVKGIKVEGNVNIDELFK